MLLMHTKTHIKSHHQTKIENAFLQMIDNSPLQMGTTTGDTAF